MSSFDVHKSDVLDVALPIKQRYSHLRSCLNKLTNLKGCKRSSLVEDVVSKTGINVEQGCSEAELLMVLELLLKVRTERSG